MYTIQCTLYTVQRAPYNVHCTTCTVQCAPYNIHRTTYTVQCTPYNVHRTLCTVQCAPYNVHRTIVHRTTHTVQCTPYNVQRTPYSDHPGSEHEQYMFSTGTILGQNMNHTCSVQGPSWFNIDKRLMDKDSTLQKACGPSKGPTWVITGKIWLLYL